MAPSREPVIGELRWKMAKAKIAPEFVINRDRKMRRLSGLLSCLLKRQSLLRPRFTEGEFDESRCAGCHFCESLCRRGFRDSSEPLRDQVEPVWTGRIHQDIVKQATRRNPLTGMERRSIRFILTSDAECLSSYEPFIDPLRER